MILPVMMFALGFLCAFLLAILILPPFIRKSVRNAALPRQKKKQASLKEGRAERDRMRAEFAISLRKQEQTVETLKARAQQQLIDIAQQNAHIRDIKREMSEITNLADRRYEDKKQLRKRLEMMNRANGTEPKPAEADISNQEDISPAAVSPAADAPGENTSQAPIPASPRLPGTAIAKDSASAVKAASSAKGLAGRIQKLKKNA